MVKNTFILPPTSADTLATCRQLLPKLLSRLNRGNCLLKVPEAKNTLKTLPGHHFHLWPEIFVQFSGLTRFSCPGQRFTLYPGEICVMPRGVPHHENIASFHGPFFNMVIMLSANELAFHFAAAHDKNRPITLANVRIKSAAAAKLTAYLDALVPAFHTQNLAGHTTANGLLAAFIGSFAGLLEKNQNEPVLESLKVSQCRQGVALHLTEPTLSVNRMAQLVRCSPVYLSHLFHTETGQTLINYINQQRLELAQELLRKTTLSIKEVSLACGYLDPGYLARLFRSLFGQTPREYRRSAGGVDS